jgi:hypothetical protein
MWRDYKPQADFKGLTRCDVFNICGVPSAHDTLKGLSTDLKERRHSVMRYEFNPVNKAMIRAHQDYLLSARPR